MIRAVVFGIILVLMAAAVTVGLSAKPLEPPLVIDEHSTGVWPRYADAPIMPGVVVCKPMLIPGAPGAKPIART